MATMDEEGAAERVWRLLVLGPVEVYLGTHKVEVQGVARALLALLTRSAGQVVSVETIVDGLWGTSPPAGAERAVASYVSRLRKALTAAGGVDAARVVLTRPPGYLLALDPSTVDLFAFETAVAEGQRALSLGQPALAAGRLGSALALWRGDAYADVGDVAFAPVEAHRLAELRLAAVESRIDAELAAAAPVAPSTVVGELQSLVVAHPHRERFWHQLITCLYRLGRQADALAAYQRARTRLIEDLGVEPGPELRAVERAVLAGDASLNGRTITATAVPEDLPGPVPGCVGRDDELAWLESALDSASVAHGEARLIVGGAGYGKSRLAAELAHRASRRGVLIQYGRAEEALDALCAEPDRLNLVILDDVDQAGAATIARVAAWVRASRTRPVLTIVTATEPVCLGGLANLPRLDLAPLTDRAVADVVRLYLPSGSIDAHAAAGANGVPRLVHEAASVWASAHATRRLGRAVDEVVKPQRQLAALHADIVSSVLDLGHVRAASRAVRGRDVVVCPYKGLASFELADADLFHGREALVAELVTRLVQGRLLAVVGASGSGKSSAVRAGLLPALAAGVLPGSARWPRLVITPAGCRNLAARLAAEPRARDHPTLLFIDQFEEVFTALDAESREAFLGTLVEVVGSGRVNAVVALRSDFYGRCADHAELAPLITANTVLVRPMATDEVRRAIERPAALAGLLLEDGLSDRLVDDVRGAPGGLPLLSTSLLSLWEHRSGRTLTCSAYREAGGVAGAVEQLGERAFASFATDKLRDTARRMLLRLADTGGEHSVIRRRATRTEVESVGGAVAGPVLAILADRRLVTISDGIVEVAHEALLTEWPRLRRWLEEDADGRELRAHLTPAAMAWAKGHDIGELYRGARLAGALDWLCDHASELTPAEREFLDASRMALALEDLGRRRTVRRLRQMLVAVATALVIAMAGGIVAVTQQRRADEADAEADAGRLAEQALVERDLGRAMLFGVAATRLDDSPKTRANLLATLDRAPALLRTVSLPDGDRYQAMSLSPDGQTLALGSVRGAIQLYDAGSLHLRRTLTFPRSYSVRALDFTPDGQRLVTFGDLAAGTDHGIIEWDLATGTPLGEPFGPMSAAAGSVLVDGDSVAVLDADSETAEVWSLAKRERVRVLPRAGSIASMTVGSDRRTIVVGHDEGTTTVDGLTGASQRYPQIAIGGVISPDGHTMLVREGPDVAVWDLTTQSRRGAAGQHENVIDLVWANDAKTFVTTSADRTVIVWDAATLRPVNVFEGPAGRQLRAAYSLDGRTLFTAGEDGAAYVWDLTDSRRGQTLLDPPGPYSGTKLDPESASAVFDPAHGRAIVTEGALGYVVNDTTGKPIGLPFDLGSAQHQRPELSADGSYLALALADGRGRVWDVASRQLLLDIAVRDPRDKRVGAYVNAGISGDGHTVAFAAYQPSPANRTEVSFYDIRSGRRLDPSWTIEGTGSGRIGASADGTYLAVTTSTSVAVWDLKHSREVARLELPMNASAMVARFSPDGQYLAVGNVMGRPALWRVADWSLMWQADYGHNGYDVAVSFSPDGKVLASSGTDSKILLYDLATGELIGGAFGSNRNSRLYAAYRTDRDAMVGYFDDGSMATWDVDPAAQIRTACTIAGRDMTPKEWDKFVLSRPYQSVCPG